jgi:hypothetical protein
MTCLRLAGFAFICATTTSLAAYAQGTEPHGWLNTETLKTRSCDFEFKNGYPVGDTAQRLLDLQKFNRAVEVYLTQLMPVSEIALREGMRAFGSKKPAQVKASPSTRTRKRRFYCRRRRVWVARWRVPIHTHLRRRAFSTIQTESGNTCRTG